MRPWMVDIRRGAAGDIRSALVSVKHRPPPAYSSVPGEVLGCRGGEPSGVTSLFLMAAQSCGPGSRPEQVALKCIDRTRLNRAPHMEIKGLLGPHTQGMGRALGCFRRVAMEPDCVLARALSHEREYICDAVRILFTPYAPNVKRSAPPVVLPVALRSASGIIRSLSRIAEDAARVENGCLRAFDACYE